MTQGFVLTQYFYEQMIQFEKDPASLNDTIGEMVYSMDVDQQVHRARQTEFDKEADGEVLERSKPRKLSGLDLAEQRLSAGDVAAASAMARKVLEARSDTLQSNAESARAYFILARVAVMTGHPEDAINDFQKTLAPARNRGCSPGLTFTWAECWIWTASATRQFPSTTWPLRSVTANRILAWPRSAA